MDGMEDKLGAILRNPQMMQQIMSMAQSLSGAQDQPAPVRNDPPGPVMPDFDPAMLQKIMSITGNLSVDQNQQALLTALRPYLSAYRIQKLEKAMRAAKLATAASSALSNGALSFLTGG